MTRVLLLDDSLTILKVVRLTFASTTGMDVAVAKTEAEARAALAGSKPDVVIGYARFCQERTVEFFEEVRSTCKNIVVLTESNENIQGFVSRGFNRFLKKPFHSEELRKAVGEDVSKAGSTPDTAQIPSEDAKPAPSASNAPRDEGEFTFSVGEFSNGGDEPTLAAKTVSRANAGESATPARKPPPPPPPPPPPRVSPPSPPSFDGGAAARLVSPTPPPSAQTTVDIPQITMDVESLERSYRATLTQRTTHEATVVSSAPRAAESGVLSDTPVSLPSAPPASPRVVTAAPPVRASQAFDASEPTLTFSGVPERPAVALSSAEREPQGAATPTAEANPFAGLFDGAAAKRVPHSHDAHGGGRGIELGAPPTEPMELEDVVVSTPSRARSDIGEFTNPFQGTRPDPAPHKARSAFDSLGIGSAGGHNGSGGSETGARTSAGSGFGGGITRAEIEATIDDVLMRSLERAVPAKIESKFDQEWNRMALDVALRIKADVATALKHDLTAALQGLIEGEVRRELQGWMAREAVGLAKDVVREEIRRLIEE